MATVSIRDLRNHASGLVERARRGERLMITRAGEPVAQLVALPRPGVSIDEFRRRWAELPPVDPAAVRRDIDDVLDDEVCKDREGRPAQVR